MWVVLLVGWGDLFEKGSPSSGWAARPRGDSDLLIGISVSRDVLLGHSLLTPSSFGSGIGKSLVRSGAPGTFLWVALSWGGFLFG